MQITVNLKAYYDWEKSDAVPSEADILALKAKPTQDGKWLRKVVKTTDTHTSVNLPETEIQDCMAHFQRVGLPKTRAKTVAWYLDEKIMIHHAHPDHWVSISVHDEPEVEAFLNRHFDLNKADGY